jgi:hypothetical protein
MDFMTDETNADLVEMLRIIVPCTDKQAVKFFASSLALSVTPDHLRAVLAWADARRDSAIDEAIKTCVDLNRALSASRTLVGELVEALEEAANALESIGERTWDKRHHDECRAACADACEMAGAHEDARKVIAKVKEPPPMYDPARDGPQVPIPTPQGYFWNREEHDSRWVLKLHYKDRAVMEKAMTALRVAMEAGGGEQPAQATQPAVTAEDVAELAEIVSDIADRMMPGQVALKWKAETLANRLRGGADV